MSLFSPDGAFTKYGSMLFDLIVLNILVILITLFTAGIGFGAALTAMFFAIDRTLFEGRGYCLRNFAKSLRLNWKQATLLWVGAVLILGLNQWALHLLDATSSAVSILYMLQLLLFFETSLILLYAFPMLSLIEINIKTLVGNSFLIGHRHLLWSIICILSISAGVYMTFELHGVTLLLLVSGLGTFVNAVVVRRILVNYMTQEQREQLFESPD